MFGFNKPPPSPSSPPDPSKLILHPNESLALTLASGRTLGYAIYGSTTPSDPAIFLFHGLPGSRITGRSWDKLCQRLSIRLIAIDRPGYGLSTLENRPLVAWPEDVLIIANHLDIQQFSILGASGGAPYALACTRFIPPTRLRGTIIVCGIGPIDAYLDTVPYLSWRFGGLTSWAVKFAAKYIVLPNLMSPYRTQDPAALKAVLESQCVTPEEKAAIRDNSRDTNVDDVIAALLEAFKQSMGGCLHDGTLLASEWGFDLKDVDSEGKVWMLHGDQDAQAPVGVARWVDERLGGGKLKVVEGGTHFTIWKEWEERIFEWGRDA
jgi:pimeloyl-ACP methyl ester carboxylesterase